MIKSVSRLERRTPLQVAQSIYWRDLGTCERVRMNLMAMPDDPLKNEALEYVARVKKIICMNYAKEKARLIEEAETLKAEGWDS